MYKQKEIHSYRSKPVYLERIAMGTKDASPVAFPQQINLMLHLNLEYLPSGVLLKWVLSYIQKSSILSSKRTSGDILIAVLHRTL